jgi:hypothetical protein
MENTVLKSLGIELNAFIQDGSWLVTVSRPGIGSGHIQFKVKTRVEYGQLDPYDALVGLCETFVSMPSDEYTEGYHSWLDSMKFANTDDYYYRWRELVKQRSAMHSILKLNRDELLQIAQTRDGASKLALPTIDAGIRRENHGTPAPVQLS